MHWLVIDAQELLRKGGKRGSGRYWKSANRIVPHLKFDREVSQAGAGNPLNLFETRHGRRQPRVSYQCHERVHPAVPREGETRSGLNSP